MFKCSYCPIKTTSSATCPFAIKKRKSLNAVALVLAQTDESDLLGTLSLLQALK